MNSSQKKVTCRRCKEDGSWEVETPGGKVLPNHFNTKADCVRVGKKYAMEAGAELVVEPARKMSRKTTSRSRKRK